MNHPSKDTGEHVRMPVTKWCMYRFGPDPTPGACHRKGGTGGEG